MTACQVEGLFSAQVDYIYHVETPSEHVSICLGILSSYSHSKVLFVRYLASDYYLCFRRLLPYLKSIVFCGYSFAF